MFYGATNLVGDFSAWNVGSVLAMAATFYNAINFNSDLSNRDVSKVTNMRYMFQ